MLIAVADTCSFGGITLGQTDSFGVEWYFLGIEGRGAVGSTSQLTQKAGADGGFASPAQRTGRTFTITGSIFAPDRPSLIAAFDRLQGAASIDPQPFTVTTGGAARYCMAARQSAVTPTEQGDSYTEFAATFIVEDSRWFGADLVVSTMLPNSTGGWTFPFTFPLTIASTVISGTCSAINQGNADGPVTLRIDGPVTAPIVTHVGSGAALVFASSYTLQAGAWLDVNMDAHTVLENGQADRLLYMTQYGWSKFDAESTNTWAFTNAGAYSSTAQLTVHATPAWL